MTVDCSPAQAAFGKLPVNIGCAYRENRLFNGCIGKPGLPEVAHLASATTPQAPFVYHLPIGSWPCSFTLHSNIAHRAFNHLSFSPA